MADGLIMVIAIIFFIVILIVVSNLQSRVTFLQLQVQSLKKRIDEQEKQPTTHIIESNSTPNTSEVKPSSIALSPPSAPVSTHRFEPIKHAEKPVNHSNEAQPSVTKPATEHHFMYHLAQWLIKGNPVAKLAIVILFFGLSYLLKYSIDHELLSPEIRTLGSLCLGLILLTAGWKLRNKKALYALILQGGSIGILYFTLFAAFKLYALVPAVLTFALLVIICACSVMFAVIQRAISLAVIASIGGYLAPILLSTGSGNHIALFSYYLILSTAILTISFWQSWRQLNLIGFVFTFIVAIVWGIRSFKPEFYLECQLFILANMLIYGILAVLLFIRNDPKMPYGQTCDLTLLFSVPLAAFSLQYAITAHWQYAPAFSALGFGLFYLIGSFGVLRCWQNKAKQIALCGLAIGLTFSTLAVPLALTASWTALVWLLEGTAISCVALSQKQHRLAYAGAIVVLLGLASSVVANIDYIDKTSFITLYAMISALLLFNACLWHHYRSLHSSANDIKLVFLCIAAIFWSVWMIGSVYLITDTTANAVQPIIACYIIAVWLWFFIGRKINWPVLNYAVIALWPVLLLALVNHIAQDNHAYANGLWGLSWLVAFISAYCYLYFNANHLNPQSRQLTASLHISLLWIILGWLYHNIDAVLSDLPWGFEVLELSVLIVTACLVIFVFLMLNQYHLFPMQNESKLYWQIALLPPVLYLLYTLLVSLTSSGQIINWTYLPLFNPLDESTAFALLMLSVWRYQTIKSFQPPRPISLKRFSLLTLFLLAGLTFLWGNSIIIRTLSQWLNISWLFYTLWHNHIIQVVLSLVWTLTALILIAIAHRYAMRKLWFAGVILQAWVVIKLALVDSVELDGLMRAFVFIGVALLMLIIGYLAPLPPKQNRLSCDATI
ncbi:putative membrane protein [Orbus hercynius]|uniref:Putative membrane protein n=1 Tax=Orbus hercynius TaxID=593135 RepID=A0A495RC52_9GAMM|nr:DUF2339 domain-containing protein [Orbus hercynius]RKS85043.1 putative membrane protein [Orbus hercynius]